MAGHQTAELQKSPSLKKALSSEFIGLPPRKGSRPLECFDTFLDTLVTNVDPRFVKSFKLTDPPTTGNFLGRSQELQHLFKELSQTEFPQRSRVPIIQTSVPAGTSKSVLLQELARILGLRGHDAIEEFNRIFDDDEKFGNDVNQKVLTSFFPICITWNHHTRVSTETFEAKQMLLGDELWRLKPSIAM